MRSTTTVLKLGGELLDDRGGGADARPRRSSASPRRRRSSSCTAAAARSTPSCAPAARRRASWTACASPTRPRSTPSSRVLAGRTNTRARRGDRRRRRPRGGPDRRRRTDRPVEPAGAASTSDQRRAVDLGLVGQPDGTGRVAAAAICCGSATSRSSPASASRATGALLNVNADTIAAHLAALARRRSPDHRRRDRRRARQRGPD